MRSGNKVQRPHIWTSIAVLVCVLAFLLPPLYGCGCGTKGEFLVEQMVKAAEGATIQSSDNRITVEIPPDALSDCHLPGHCSSVAGWTGNNLGISKPCGGLQFDIGKRWLAHSFP